MKELLKYTRANVRVADTKTGCLLFTDSNLFVDSGREFIAKTFINTIEGGGFIDKTKYACDLGDNAQTPVVTDTDLVGTVLANIAIDVGGPTALVGETTGLNFQFVYSAGALITIREFGLFYRPVSDTFPARGSVPASMTGTLLARLRTTLSAITVGAAQSITIDWKIIF
jgi:hypothetical protein